jgi:hypothetical protein
MTKKAEKIIAICNENISLIKSREANLDKMILLKSFIQDKNFDYTKDEMMASDDLINFHYQTSIINTNLVNKLYSENKEPWEKYHELCKTFEVFSDKLEEHEEIVFPSVRTGLLAKLRNKYRHYSSLWSLSGTLEINYLASKIGVVKETMPEMKFELKFDLAFDLAEREEYNKKFKEHNERRRKLKSDIEEKFRRDIMNEICNVQSPNNKFKIISKNHVFEWEIENDNNEKRIIQLVIPLNRRKSCFFRQRGNFKSDWLEGRMFFFNGIMIHWKKTPEGSRISLPRNILNGRSSSYIIYDLVSSKILSPA